MPDLRVHPFDGVVQLTVFDPGATSVVLVATHVFHGDRFLVERRHLDFEFSHSDGI
jgi:hypothetical protein